MRSAATGRRAGQRGFTLLEVLIAAALLIIAMVGSIALILGLLQANRTAKFRDVGYFLAQQALDDLSLVPLVGPSTAYLAPGNPAAAAVPSAPICYPMSNDVIPDRPIACVAGISAAFVVRTWTCCNTTLTGTDSIAAGTPCLGSNPALTCPGESGCPIAGLQTPDNVQQSAVCYVQAEVTWPAEDPAGGNLLGSLSIQEALFSDPPIQGETSSNTKSPITFGNHVWATMVRQQ